jgi:ABC-2 type transport system ATP-binding protein
VAVLGGDPRRADRARRARVGLMLQGGGGIDPRLTAREAVGLFARFHANPMQVDEVLRAVGLSGDAATRTRYRRLSGGERQRVALAVALVGRPDVAILDEPTAGMDVEARATTRDLLRGLRDAGAAILITSHDLTEVERVADRIAILDRGRIVALGTPAELASGGTPAVRFRVAVPLSEADCADLASSLGPAVTVRPEGASTDASGSYRVAGTDATPALVAAVAAWFERRGQLLGELRTTGATLEQRYLELTRGADAEPDAAEPGS